MRPCVPAALLLVATQARADEPITIESTSETADQTRAPRHHEAPRQLEFDPTVRVSLDRLDRQVTRIQLSSGLDLSVEGAWPPSDPLRFGDRKTPVWRAGVSASYDLGFARLSASATYEQISNELGSAAAIVYDISLSRTFALSRTVAGFVKLGVNRREWRDHLALPGEFDDTRVMLWLGLTW